MPKGRTDDAAEKWWGRFSSRVARNENRSRIAAMWLCRWQELAGGGGEWCELVEWVELSWWWLMVVGGGGCC